MCSVVDHMTDTLLHQLQQLVLCTASIVADSPPQVLQVLQIVPCQQLEPAMSGTFPGTAQELTDLLVTKKVLPTTYYSMDKNSIPLRAIAKLISITLSHIHEVDEKRKMATAFWIQLKHSNTAVTMIPFIESVFTKHICSSVFATKKKILEENFRAVDIVRRKHIISTPNPYNTNPTTTRKILSVSHWRIPNNSRGILDEYWNKYLRDDGKSYLPPNLFPLLEQLTGLPKKTIMISLQHKCSTLIIILFNLIYLTITSRTAATEG